MNSAKIDFISELLSRKDIHVSEKESLFALTKEELKKMGKDDAEKIADILKRIEKLEGEKNNSEFSGLDGGIKKVEKNRPHRPKETKSFLSLFNNSDGIKYLTHKFKSEKPEYVDFINLCKREFEENKEKYPNTAEKLLSRIKEFAFSEKPDWFIRKGKEREYKHKGWSESSFVEWYKQPVNTHPGWDAKWNEEMIIPFKESIEVRAGNLYSIIEQSLKIAMGESINNFDIEQIINNKNNLNTAEFYTDVDLFQQALFLVFSMINERSKKNLEFGISVDYENETLAGGDFKKVIITHINSEATKKANDPEFVKGDFHSIITNLWGLCNYEINAKFPDGYYKKIFLTDNFFEYRNYVSINKAILIDDISKVTGFTHIFKFY